MTQEAPLITLEAHPLTLYALRVLPLWEGDAEIFELNGTLAEILDTITRERSVGRLVGQDRKPMRYCRLEQQEAIVLPRTRQTFYARERTPVWKVMVPASGIYSRETIVSCLSRSTGRNADKYANALYQHPKAEAFYTYSNSEILPLDETVFVIEHPAR